MNRIDVLDHGFVALRAYMQPAIDLSALDDPEFGGSAVDLFQAAHEKWTGDLEIVRNARVSYDADWRTGTHEGSDDRLVRRLYARGHTSPFEAMVFTFEVKAPIFVFRQWHRHRTWSYNELSARYGVLPEEFYVPKSQHIGYQDKKDKQGREGQHEFADKVAYEIQSSSIQSHRAYHALVDADVSRELSRLVLPVNTYSRMFATVNLHNLFKFLTLRLDSHAQYEIRVYAEALKELIRPIVPIAVEAFDKGLLKLTAEEIQAVVDSIELDLEVNADDSLDLADTKHYQLLKSALAKLEKA